MIAFQAGVRQSSLSMSAEALVSAMDRFEGEPAATAVPDHDIRAQAYRLYELRGREEGHAVEDWLTAERYLTARKNRANKVIFR